MEVDFIQSISKLEIKEKDIIVIKVPFVLSRSVYENLKNLIFEVLKSQGFQNKVIVLENGVDIGILRKEGI